MAARTGQQYIAALQHMKPCIYLHGRRVEDVTREPIFQGPLQAIAQLYDLQHDPRYHDFMTYLSPTTGEAVSSSFLIPHSHADIIKKRQTFKLRTDHSFGFMGRIMDFMNCLVTGWYLNRDVFAQRGARFAENAARYYEHVRDNDLFLTHVLVNPQIDRSRTSAEQEEPFLHLGRVRETPQGIVVRGAKMLGTMAPLTEEILSIPFGGMAPGDDAYALAFSIPTDTPGLKFICRETMTPQSANHFDHPMSSRFEEMDCIVIFDDVLVPWERVMVDGGHGSVDVVNQIGPNMAGMINVQTSSRMLSQMEFFCGLAMKLADAIGIQGFLHIQEKLGEMLSSLEIARGVFYGSEALAREGNDGIWSINPIAGRGFHLQTMRIYRRFIEIVHILGGGGFFYAASQADLENPEERPYIDKYLRGRPGVSAEERIRLFKLAWDVTGSAFAQRVTQYVTFYSGDPVRLTAGFYLAYDKDPLFDIVERALGTHDAIDIPISPTDPGAPVSRRSPRTEELTHAYPAASHPQQRRPSGTSG